VSEVAFAQEEEVKETRMVRLKNKSPKLQTYQWDGMPYVWRPGEEMQVPIGIAAHFVGKIAVGTMEADAKPNDILSEEKRVLELLPQDERGDGCPLEVVEVFDPASVMVEKTEFVSEPGVVEPEGEQPFASVKPKPVDEQAKLLAEAQKAKAEKGK
jgi:hypothetical protein